jgi:hypothetical protein
MKNPNDILHSAFRREVMAPWTAMALLILGLSATMVLLEQALLSVSPGRQSETLSYSLSEKEMEWVGF